MSFRKKPVKKPFGAYWLIERGSGENLQRITLGYVTEAEAENARLILEDDEKRTWVASSASGPVETSLTHADYLLCLWTTGRPPFPGVSLPDLFGPLLELPDKVRLAEARKSVLAYLGDRSWRALEKAFGDAETPARLMTLQAYYDTHYAPWRQVHRPRTWKTEEGHWRRILRVDDGLGGVRLGEIDAHNVADYVDALTIERARKNEGVEVGDPASGATKRLHKAAITALLKRAYRLKHIDQMPQLAEFTIEGSTKKVRDQAEPLTLEEVARLLEGAPSPMHRGLFGLGIGEGLRPSELIRVQWQDIDWVEETISVRGDEETGEGKTAASVDVIPLTPLALAEMRRWWEAQKEPKKGIAFPAPKSLGHVLGTEPYSDGTGYKKALAGACTKAGIDRRMTPNLLRHTTATLCWAVGIDLDTARRILRHTDESMLRKVYARPRPADIKKRLQALRLPDLAPSPVPAQVEQQGAQGEADDVLGFEIPEFDLEVG